MYPCPAILPKHHLLPILLDLWLLRAKTLCVINFSPGGVAHPLRSLQLSHARFCFSKRLRLNFSPVSRFTYFIGRLYRATLSSSIINSSLVILRTHTTTGSRSPMGYLIYFCALSIAGLFSNSAGTLTLLNVHAAGSSCST